MQFYVTPEMEEMATKVSSELYDIQVASSIGGKKQKEIEEEHKDNPNLDIFSAYLDGRITATMGIYLAIDRVKK